jgi:hypothetical protein
VWIILHDETTPWFVTVMPGRYQILFPVCAMNPENCGVTSVPLQSGHVGFAFSRSEIVMMSSKDFLHFSQRNSYRGMVFTPFSQGREALSRHQAWTEKTSSFR